MGLIGKADVPAITLKDVEPTADLLRSLANPQRLMIMCTLIDGERAVSELEARLGIRQPSLSQHLGSLRDAGLIAGRRKAKAVFYRISDPRAVDVVEALHAIFCGPVRWKRAVTPSAPALKPDARHIAATRTTTLTRGDAAVFARVDVDV